MKQFLCFLITLAGLALIVFAAYTAHTAVFHPGLTDGQGAGAFLLCSISLIVGGGMIVAGVSALSAAPRDDDPGDEG